MSNGRSLKSLSRMESSKRKIRVLLSAYACEPGKGSEPGVGWNLARELSSRVALTVITRANNRPVIEASGEIWRHDVHWVYWDPPKWKTFWKKGGRGVQLFYALWQHGVIQVAARELALRDFDIIHHLTFGKYWIPSRLASLPRPFVFGPVGGGECTPAGLSSSVGMRGRLAEIAKRVAILAVCKLPGSRGLYRSAAWTFAATHQTETALKNLGVTRISVLQQSGIRPEDLPEIFPDKEPTSSPPLTLVTAARLIPWKAVDLAIEAVARAAATIDVRLVILQTGPEMDRLVALAEKLGIADRVEFKGRLPRLTDVYGEISKAHALVHPALHEAFGQACLEALGLGVPVICLNWGGPGLIVDSEAGFAVEPGNRHETVERLAHAIRRLGDECNAGISRSEACKSRAFECFGWGHLANALTARYHQILGIEQDSRVNSSPHGTPQATRISIST